MSSSGVHPDEMPSQDPLADPALASFLDDLEVVTTRPAPAPRPGLAAFFDGISPDIQPADSSAPSAPRATRRRKMTVAELLGALMAKLAGLGMVAKAGLGLGVAAASVTTAGVANVLPDPAQHAVAKVVNAVAPIDINDPADEATKVVDDVNDVIGGVNDDVTDQLPELPEVTIPELGEGDGTGTDGATRNNHGACVSAVARDKSATQGTPGSHGRAVSEVARSDCGKQTVGSPTTTTTLAPTTTTTTVDTGELGTSSRSGAGNGNGNAGQAGGNAGNAGNGGRGNANAGNGNGNSGNAGRR